LPVDGVRAAQFAHLAANGGEERVLESRPQVQQARVPLPIRIDPGKPAVVQFVTDVEGQLDVDAERIAVRDRRLDPVQARSRHAFGQEVDHGHRQRSSGRGKRRLEGGGGEGHARPLPESVGG
jgi:hypothetical protein